MKNKLQNAGVRKTIYNYIVTQITDAEFRSSVRSVASTEDIPSFKSESSAKGSVKGGAPSSDIPQSYLSSLPGADMEDIKPSYVNTNRELEHLLSDMLPWFEGRESEGNWAAREKSVIKLRELVRGNAPSDFQHTFLINIKSLTDGIMKGMTSLRTKLSTNSCQLIKDLAITCGSGMDPMVDVMLPSLIKLCAGTKKITAEAGQVTTAVLVAHVSYHTKIVNQLWLACQDKNVQPRLYASGWLRAFLEAHAEQRHHIEHGEGINTIEKCLKKGLADANPGVREGMRLTFWKFCAMWQSRGEALLESLDPKTKGQLEKDNPHSQVNKPGPRPGLVGRNTTAAAAPARMSIKEQIAAARRKAQDAPPPLESSQSFQGVRVPGAAEKTGLASAPLRPARPMRPKSQMPPRADERPDSSSSNEALNPMLMRRAESPSSSTAKSSGLSSPKGLRSPPPISPVALKGLRATNRTSPLAGSRKLTILEQLGHSDNKIRVEGIITVQCILAKRRPPTYDHTMKVPTLPPQEHLRASLIKLLNDPDQEVVEAIIAPEILKELADFVPPEQLVPKVLLHSEPETQHLQSHPSSSLIALKSLLNPVEAAELLFRVITNMGLPGPQSRKMISSGQSFTTIQKRKILHGGLLWMNELVGAVLDGEPNGFLQSPQTYRLMVERSMTMLMTAKDPNIVPLGDLLKNLQQMDEETFDKVFSTFDGLTQRELKKAWGMSEEQQNKQGPVEEEVADVQQVLGVIPDVSGSMMLPPPRPQHNLKSPERTRTDGSPFHLQEEELTMINPVSALPLPPMITRAPAPTEEELAARETKLPDMSDDEIPDLLRKSVNKTTAPVDSARRSPIKVFQDPDTASNGIKPARVVPTQARPKPKCEWKLISKSFIFTMYICLL